MHAPFDPDDLLFRFFRGETTAEENRTLLAWKRASGENRARFDTLRNLWMVSATAAPATAPDPAAALARLKRTIARDEEAQQPLERPAQPNERQRAPHDGQRPDERPSDKRSFGQRPPERHPQPLPREERPARRRSVLRSFVRSAAAVLLLAGAAGGGALLHRAIAPAPPAAEALAERFVPDTMLFRASRGSLASATLPDGTVIRLNAGSTLTYTTDYGRKERTVALQGEAFFKVRADAERPFVVRAGELAIVATGTAFNVKAYPEEQFVTTTLESGSVRVQGLSRRNRSFDIELTPRQSCLYYRGGDSVLRSGTLHPEEAALAEQVRTKEIPALRISNVKTLLHTSWKDPRWIVEYETLASLAEKLERRYNVTIRFRQSEAGAYRFTGAFENETIEEIMRLLRHATPIRYTIERGRITVSVDPSRRRTFENAAG